MNQRKTARFVRRLEYWSGDARLFEVHPPVETRYHARTSFVAVQAHCPCPGVEETHILPTDPGGKVIDWNDLPGSYTGSCDHKRALWLAGYEVAA